MSVTICYNWVIIHLFILGHYVPQLAQLIYRKNKSIQNPTINLKGFMVIINCAVHYPSRFVFQET